jgi:ABC-type amino acid transport substrate-binding protein
VTKLERKAPFLRRIRRWFSLNAPQIFSKKMIPIWAGLAAMIILVVFVGTLGSDNSRTIKAEDTRLYGSSTIYVDVVECPGFVQKNEDGEAEGFDIDLITELLQGMYPTSKIHFSFQESQLVSYDLRNGKVDLAIGTFTKGVTKTLGLSVSNGYFTDGVYAYVAISDMF